MTIEISVIIGKESKYSVANKNKNELQYIICGSNQRRLALHNERYTSEPEC